MDQNGVGVPDIKEVMHHAVDSVGGEGLSDLMLSAEEGVGGNAVKWDEAFWSIAGILSRYAEKDTVKHVKTALNEAGLLGD